MSCSSCDTHKGNRYAVCFVDYMSRLYQCKLKKLIHLCGVCRMMEYLGTLDKETNFLFEQCLQDSGHDKDQHIKLSSIDSGV